ncbi:AAA family ATPase [Streptomyces himalayensis]
MAAGKSTVAQALAERLPRAVHVRGDVFRRMIVSGRAEYEPGAGAEAEAQLRLRYRLSALTADEYAKAGFTAVVQDVVLGEDLRSYVASVRTLPPVSRHRPSTERLRRAPQPLYVVVLAPLPEAVAEREAARAKTGYGAWTVAELDRGLRAETPPIGLWLDTSDLTVSETVAAILSGLDEARLA